MQIVPENLSPLDLYKILTGSVLPRPIAWVSSLDKLDNMNLAPFSFFNVASVNPPMLCFSPLLDEARFEKDTLVNIRQTGEFVVNVASCSLVGQMNQTSAPYPADVSEFAESGVTPQPSAMVRTPGVKAAKVRFECTLEQVVCFGSQPLAGNLVLGRICHIYLHPDVYQDGRINLEVLDPVGRLAGDYYSTTRDHFALPRPKLPPE